MDIVENTHVEYEAPAIEQELSSDDVEREVLYAGRFTDIVF